MKQDKVKGRKGEQKTREGTGLDLMHFSFGTLEATHVTHTRSRAQGTT